MSIQKDLRASEEMFSKGGHSIVSIAEEMRKSVQFNEIEKEEIIYSSLRPKNQVSITKVSNDKLPRVNIDFCK